MKSRLALVLFVLATSPALAQPRTPPAKTPPAKAPAAPPAKTPAQEGLQETSAFEKELNALFVAGGMTADQAASRAARVSPEVARRVAELQASIAQQEAAELARVPQLSAKATYTRLSPIDPISFGGGFALEFPVNSYATEASLGVPLSDYLLRFPKLVGASRLATEAARTNKLSSEINAAQEARLAYYEWVRARLQALVAEHQHTNVQAVLKQVRALAEAQRLSKADLMRVESNEAESQREADQLNYLTQLREEQLRLLIGAKPDEKLSMGESERGQVNAPAPRDLDDLVSIASTHRLEFRAIDLGIRAREKQRESARADAFPRLSAFAIGDYANPNQRVFPTQQKWDFTWQAGVQLSWSLNDTLQSNANDKRLRAETDQLRADRESLLRGTRIEVLAAQQGVETAQLSLVTTEKGLAAAEESYRVRRELLNAERATAVELVDAETDLTRARIAAINARINLRVALAQLVHSLGQDAPKH
jgi:outer membrane protein